jgi:hypothetical protein
VKSVVAGALILLTAAPAAAQSGPVTASLTLGEPRAVAVRLGPLMISPSLTLPEVGYDSNVFDEDIDPKGDWTIRMTPALNVYARTGVIQFVISGANEFTWYDTYESERSIARQFRGRLDAELSRVRPWVAAARLDLHDRPNREIDLRARHTDLEVSGGVSFQLSGIADVYGMVARTESQFSEDEIFRGVDLDTALTQRTDLASAGLKLRATPFTTIRLDASVSRDRFADSPSRNSESQTLAAIVEIAPEAILSGTATVGFQKFDPTDPAVMAYDGMVTGGSLLCTILGRATLNAVFERKVRYSFEIERQYYVESGAEFIYTHRVTGPVDVQATAARRWLDYTRNTPGLIPRVDAAGIGLGYNLADGSRIGFTYEYSQRLDELRPDRKYDRQRYFGTYTIRR